ncbi:MAG: response regulator [Gammaproteobacteria bacterium]
MHALLIEDNPDHQWLIHDLFSQSFSPEAILEQTTTLEAGLLRARAQSYDLCLCDLNLPDSPWASTIERLCTTQFDFPLIVLSAVDDLETTRQLAQHGVEDFLPKDQLRLPIFQRICIYAVERYKNRNLQKERDAALQKQAVLLSQLEYRSEFLANVSHELRSPLNSILLLAQVLLENRGENLQVDQQQSLRVIQQSGQQMLLLINDLLDHRKMGKGKLSVEISSLAVAAMVRGLKEEFIAEFAYKKIRFRVDNYCAEDFCFFSDERRLQQILRNLLTNAYKFTAEGGEVRVVFQPLTDEQFILQIDIIDNGCGIDKAELPFVFEPFFQGCVPSRERHHGTGLGLSIVKSLSQLLDITVSVDSALGVGCVFQLKIPTVSKKAKVNTENVHTPGREGGSQDRGAVMAAHTTPIANEIGANRIVVRDDGPINEISAERRHQLKDKKVLIVDDDVRSVYALRTTYPDIALILMDVMMPGMNGFQATKQIRALPDYAQVPIVCVSGHVNHFDADLAQAQVDAFLRKPIQLRELHAQVVRCLLEPEERC